MPRTPSLATNGRCHRLIAGRAPRFVIWVKAVYCSWILFYTSLHEIPRSKSLEKACTMIYNVHPCCNSRFFVLCVILSWFVNVSFTLRCCSSQSSGWPMNLEILPPNSDQPTWRRTGLQDLHRQWAPGRASFKVGPMLVKTLKSSPNELQRILLHLLRDLPMDLTSQQTSNIH